MKKVIFFFLVLGLVLSFSAFAFAEEELEVIEYNWANVESVFKDAYAGESRQWYIEEVDATIWLPNAFAPEELTAEDRAQGLIHIFSSPSGSNYIMMSYSEVENFSVVAMYAVLKEAENDADFLSVNEIPAVLLRDEENNCVVLMFETREGKLFQIVFFPSEDLELYDLIIESIQPYVEEVEAAAAPVNPVSGLISK